jgi:hypothetical protein
MTEKQVRDYDKFMLRFPDGMRDAIAERAKQNGRSMNSEIVQILQDALDGRLEKLEEVIHKYGSRVNPISELDDVEKVYREVISSDPENLSPQDFDKNNEKIDWLVEQFMDRIREDTSRFQSMLKFKSALWADASNENNKK